MERPEKYRLYVVKKRGKGNPANGGYRTMVAKVASAYKKATSTEKREISMRLVEDLQNRVYYFACVQEE